MPPEGSLVHVTCSASQELKVSSVKVLHPLQASVSRTDSVAVSSGNEADPTKSGQTNHTSFIRNLLGEMIKSLVKEVGKSQALFQRKSVKERFIEGKGRGRTVEGTVWRSGVVKIKAE